MKTVNDIMTQNPVSVEEGMTIMNVISKLKDNRISQVPVVSGKRYVGMLGYREILRRKSISINARVGNMAVTSSTLSPSDSIESALRKLKQSGNNAIPVVEKDHLVGIVSRSDILKNIEEFSGMENMKIMDIIIEDPFLVKESEDAEKALEIMRSQDSSEIPVVDDLGKITGIIRFSEISDIDYRGEFAKLRFGQLSAGDMEKGIICGSIKENPVYALESDNILDTRDTLIESKLHSVPVCTKDLRVIGIITIDDILNTIPAEKSDDGIMLNISGLGTGDSDLYDIIYFLTDKFTQRVTKVAGLNNGTLNIYVMKHHSQGRTKYSIRTRFAAKRTNMTISDHDWNFGKCLSRIFETYEKRLKKDMNKD